MSIAELHYSEPYLIEQNGSITFGMGRDFWHSEPQSISYW